MLDDARSPASAVRRSNAFERFGAPAAVLDACGIIVETNEAWRLFALLNGAGTDATGPGVDYLAVCDRAAAAGIEAGRCVAAGLRGVLAGQRGSFEFEYPCPSPLEDRWFLLQASPAPVLNGAGAVLFHVNVTAHKLRDNRAAAGAVAEVADRAAGIAFIDRQLERAGTRLTAIHVGIGGLDRVDEELGILAGPALMVQATARALRAVRVGDQLYQLGDHTLVVVCADIGITAVAGIVRRLQLAIAEPFQVGAAEVSLRAIVGSAAATAQSTATGLVAAAAVAASRADQRERAESDVPAPDLPAIRSWPATRRKTASTIPFGAAQAQRDAVVAHSSDLVMYFEADGTIAWASPATRLIGIDPDALVGRSGLALIHPDDQERAFAELHTLNGFGDHVTAEFRIITEDGSLHWIEETVTNLIDDPNVGYIVGNLRDITVRKQYEETQSHLSAIVTYSTDAIFSTALDGIVETWNNAATKLYGYTPEEIIGRHASITVPPHLVASLGERRLAVNAGHAPQYIETVARHADGTDFDISVSISPIRNAGGEVIGTSRVARDISEQVGLRQQQDLDRHRLADAQRSAHLGSFELDPEAQTITCSLELKTILGVAAGAPPTFDAFEARVHPSDRALVEERFAAAILGEPEVEYTHRIVRPDGAVRWVAARLAISADPTSLGISGTLLDITDRKQLELDLLEQATHDPLTGLANRTLLLEHLERALDESDSGDAGVGVLLFDVDRFKLVNDSVGHDRGDQLLVAIAGALGPLLAADETLSRFGGDAFAIVCPRLASRGQMLVRAERIRERLRAGLFIGADRYLPTVSVGIVIARSGDLAITALRDAETAMYRAKEQGRDRSEWFDPSLHRAVVANFEVERDLRQAIEHDQLFLLFQPVLDLETGRAASCEALVRWFHPGSGPVSPDDFIPVAENTGLIVALGRWVLPHALEVAASWPKEVQVAVNLSPRELAEPDLVAFVTETLTRLQVPASRLVLEITETAVVRDPAAAARTIADLRALGVGVVIDDFGTGYTSLSFLRDYQLDGLKIDRSYVTGLDHGSTAIVDAIIRMSAALGLKVIAEGIETRAELEQLRALGCRYIQGFLVSEPVMPEDLRFFVPGLTAQPTLQR